MVFNPLVEEGFDKTGLSQSEADALYQPKEDQRLSSTDSPSFNEINVESIEFPLSDVPVYRKILKVFTTTYTSGASTVYTIPIGAGTTLVEARIVGFNAGGSANSTFVLKGSYSNSSAIQSVTKESSKSNASLDANLTISGSNVLVTATGLAGTTISWGVIIDYTNTSASGGEA